jgi:hypothetical protein
MKTPFILSKKENKDLFETCISGSQMIYNYINWLKTTDIMKTEFAEIIENCYEEFDNFLSKFPYFKTYGECHKEKNLSLEYIQKCELPFDTRCEKNKPNSNKKKNSIIAILLEINILKKQKLKKIILKL